MRPEPKSCGSKIDHGLVLSIVLAVSSGSSDAQELIVNGSFEQNQVNGCVFNLSNLDFGLGMPKVTAFGPGETIDIMEGVCGYGFAPSDGSVKVGIGTGVFGNPLNFEGIALHLAGPLVAGKSYTLRFSAHAVITSVSPEIAPIHVGLSDDPQAFGLRVFLATPSATEWSSFQVTIVAPTDSKFVTVRQTTPSHSWVHVDGFSLRPTSAWVDLGFGHPGTNGSPVLVGSGTLATGSSGALELTNARSSSAALLGLSLNEQPTPAFGSVLVPFPLVATIPVLTSPTGEVSLPWASVPPGLSGTDVYGQFLIDDPVATAGVAFSNAVLGELQ